MCGLSLSEIRKSLPKGTKITTCILPGGTQKIALRAEVVEVRRNSTVDVRVTDGRIMNLRLGQIVIGWSE